MHLPHLQKSRFPRVMPEVYIHNTLLRRFITIWQLCHLSLLNSRVVRFLPMLTVSWNFPVIYP